MVVLEKSWGGGEGGVRRKVAKRWREKIQWSVLGTFVLCRYLCFCHRGGMVSHVCRCNRRESLVLGRKQLWPAGFRKLRSSGEHPDAREP